MAELRGVADRFGIRSCILLGGQIWPGPSSDFYERHFNDQLPSVPLFQRSYILFARLWGFSARGNITTFFVARGPGWTSFPRSCNRKTFLGSPELLHCSPVRKRCPRETRQI